MWDQVAQLGKGNGAMLLPKKLIEKIISSTSNLDIKLLFKKILPTTTLCEMFQILLKDCKMDEKMWSFAWKVTPWVKIWGIEIAQWLKIWPRLKLHIHPSCNFSKDYMNVNKLLVKKEHKLKCYTCAMRNRCLPKGYKVEYLKEGMAPISPSPLGNLT